MRRLRHWLRHALRLNRGKPVTWWNGSVLMSGFRCECGEMHMAAPTHVRRGQVHQ